METKAFFSSFQDSFKNIIYGTLLLVNKCSFIHKTNDFSITAENPYSRSSKLLVEIYVL